jgi:urease accessory protein
VSATPPNPLMLSLSKHLPFPKKGCPSTGSGRALVGVLGLLSTPALAHPGHLEMSGFVAGLLHPVTGLDHLAAMLMVGLWAGTVFRNQLIVPPLAFVAFMLAGFAFGAGGGVLPLTEMLILASVIVLGAMVLFEVKPPIVAASALIALFAFAHGHAHGAEMPAGANALAFGAGFALMTALLHAAGVGLAMLASRPATRALGGGAAALGLVWMFAT